MKRPLVGVCALLLAIPGWQRCVSASAVQPQPYLTFSKLGAPIGQLVQALGSGLPARTVVQLVWFRGAPHWQVKDGLFNGVKVGDVPVPIATGTTDGQGKVAIPFTVPDDFGYIHTVTLRAGAKTLARQGFTVIPTFSISPTSGPVGTPITVTFKGDGYRLYESVWHLLYDNEHTGWLSAITTHGTATAVIPATGAVGTHILQVIEGTHPTPYLNEQQAPIYQPLIPTVLEASFRITPGPAKLPSDPAAQTLARAAGSSTANGAGPHLRLDYRSGTVGAPLTVTGVGFAASAIVHLTWSTTVGNRLSGNGFQTQIRTLPSVTASGTGAFTYTMATPDDVGGVHTLAATDAGKSTQADYTITPSIFGVSPAAVRPGAPITIHLKGVGYTQTANIYTLVMDNSFIGYACGANSQGDVTAHLFAPGGAGIHYVDLYPAIYEGNIFGPSATQKSNSANVSYFQIPMLNYADHPGEQLPAFELTFQVQA
jgi:hypothetical protein